jgi:subtilase family serine protease
MKDPKRRKRKPRSNAQRLRISFRPAVEQLEVRLVLSATAPAPTFVAYHPPVGPAQSPTPPSGSLGPQQLETGYGVDKLWNIIGDGAGQTIAIVDAYDDPGLLDSSDPNFSTSDLHNFDAQFGLADPPNFVKLDENGGTNLPSPAPQSFGGSWAVEESLDVEYVHSIAPGANIILFEANSATNLDLVQTAVATAANTPGVSVVSMSFGEGEGALGSSGESSLDPVFTTPNGHSNVTFLASTGDSGSPGGYPAYSPNVVAVGGTTLTLNGDNSYNSEVAWGGSGGGTSYYEPEPAYQLKVQSTGQRTIPDVAFDADPNSGVAVYDSYDFGSGTPWEQIGGTSLACPCWAGLIAIADQGKTLMGKPTLDGFSQTLPDLYNLFQTTPGDFHDITAGTNGGFNAGPGYDEVTGLGTPIANQLIPDLIGWDALTISAFHVPSKPTEGVGFSGFTIASFNDFNSTQTLGSLTATVVWGDGTSTNYTGANGGIVQTSSGYAVLGSHAYADEGTATLSLQIGDSNGATVGASGKVTVLDASLTSATVNALALTEGKSTGNYTVAAFTDNNAGAFPTDFTATITWGDGSTTTVSGTAGSIVPAVPST